MKMLLWFCAVAILLSSCGVVTAQTEQKESFQPTDFRGIQLKHLKEENERLKKQIQLLRKELELLKGPMGEPAKPAAATKVTRDNVEYEFVSIKMDGNVGYMKLAITAKKADKVLNTQGIRLITADGTEHKAPLIGVLKSNGLQTGRLIDGVRTVVDFKIGAIPSDITEFATIMLPGVHGGSTREALKNPVLLKGSFKVER